MKPTSHFLGIHLKNKPYESLFGELQNYFKENNIADSVEVQNILSLHITLYYFGPNIDSIKKDLSKSLSSLRKNKLEIIPTALGFFSHNGFETVCYISPTNSKTLEKLNKTIARAYSLSNIVENTYPFMPHITIFRIKNYKKFKLHKKNIEIIVNKFITDSKKWNTFNGYYMYEVNSKFKPETQNILKI